MEAIEWKKELTNVKYDDTRFWEHKCPREKAVVYTCVGEECSWCGEKEQRDEKGRPMTYWGGMK